MRFRRQLPVASPIGVTMLQRGFTAALTNDVTGPQRAAELLGESHGASAVALTDSGTSALVLALRVVVPAGGIVALPGYGCVDLVAAARYANVRVRLYDIDPATLDADPYSLRRVLRRGVDAVVVAHLYGYAVNMPEVAEIASEFGVPVIEDAAQAAGGTLRGRRLGAFGPLSVLSFGRGKGMTAGGGGALIATTGDWSAGVNAVSETLVGSGRGSRAALMTLAQWALGRPSLYGIPSAIPQLRLGEMVYHPAREPRAISLASAAMLEPARRAASRDVAIRHGVASQLWDAVRDAPGLTPVEPIADSEPGYLRFPVMDQGLRAELPDAGILRGYPVALFDMVELAPCLERDEKRQPGSAELACSLFTLPTHRMVAQRDIDRIRDWAWGPAAEEGSSEAHWAPAVVS